MKLTVNNIQFVKRIEMNGLTYNWFVSMKSNAVSDSRNFINYENGKTVMKEYKFEILPAAVRKFVETHSEELFTEMTFKDGDEYKVYIIR